MKLIIIGTGNVATSLQAAFARKHIDVPMVSSRTDLDTIPQNADVYIYAVRDNALQEVIEHVHTPQHALHIHTSGTISLDVFGPDKPHHGILYPFQSFSKAQPVDDFSDIPLFIQAPHIDDIAALYSLALTLSPHVFETTQVERQKLHLAGVFANNFTNYMYQIAYDILRTTSIPFQTLLPLIDRTAAKVHTLTPQQAQTGPAVRHDQNIIQQHLDLLHSAVSDKQSEIRDLYALISSLIQSPPTP